MIVVFGAFLVCHIMPVIITIIIIMTRRISLLHGLDHEHHCVVLLTQGPEL